MPRATTIVFSIDPGTQGVLNRLAGVAERWLDHLEGAQQGQIDLLTARLRSTNDRLEAKVAQSPPNL